MRLFLFVSGLQGMEVDMTITVVDMEAAMAATVAMITLVTTIMVAMVSSICLSLRVPLWMLGYALSHTVQATPVVFTSSW